MTDEDRKDLRWIASRIGTMVNTSNRRLWTDGDIAVVRRAAELLTPALPPPSSIAVRIAVALGDGSSHCAMIDQDVTDESQMDFVSSLVLDQAPHVLAQAIITAHIPRCVVPEVAATVEPFDPEATDA